MCPCHVGDVTHPVHIRYPSVTHPLPIRYPAVTQPSQTMVNQWGKWKVNIIPGVGVEIIKNDGIVIEKFTYSMTPSPPSGSIVYPFFGHDYFLLAGRIFHFDEDSNRWINDELKLTVNESISTVTWHKTRDDGIQLIIMPVSTTAPFMMIDLEKGFIFKVKNGENGEKKCHWMNDGLFRVIGSTAIKEYMLDRQLLRNVIISPPIEVPPFDSIMISYGNRLMFILRGSNDLIELELDRTWTHLYKFIGEAIPLLTDTAVEILRFDDDEDEDDDLIRFIYYPSRNKITVNRLNCDETRTQ